MVSRNIWVVDDDDVDLMTYQRTFRVLDYKDLNITYFKDSETMLLALEGGGQSPDLIFLDLNLPGLNGIESLQRIRQSGFYLPVVFLSTSSNSADVNVALQAGANAYFDKPVGFERSKEIIRNNIAFWFDQNLRK